MPSSLLAGEDDADMDFDLLFDEDTGRGEGDQSWHDDTCMHMNLRVMRRLLATNTDAFDRKVADQVRATVAECSSSSRDDVMGELYHALTAAGHKVIVCRAPGSGQPGHLCFTHTYMALQKENTDGTSSMLLIEPTLRDEFQVVRSQTAYTRLLDALPTVFVGPPRQLAALVDFMAVRMEESFRAGGMTSPPWRQKSSLLARWELSMGGHASHAVPLATFGSKTRAPMVQQKPSPSAVSTSTFAAPLPTHTLMPTITSSAATTPFEPPTAPTTSLPPPLDSPVSSTSSREDMMTLTDTQRAVLAALFRPAAALGSSLLPLQPLSVNAAVPSLQRRQMRRANAGNLQPKWLKC